LIPIFLGFWLGVIVGSIPVPVPGLGTSLRIGLAGGPMIVAILLSRLGHLGSVIWHMPQAANQILRDFGMAVFLACVGFQSAITSPETFPRRRLVVPLRWARS